MNLSKPSSPQPGRKQKGGGGLECSLSQPAGGSDKGLSLDPWELGGGRGGTASPFRWSRKAMAPGVRQGVGLGPRAEFTKDRLAGGARAAAPLGNLHSQVQCFIKTGKIMEEKCICQGAGIYRNGPAGPEARGWTGGGGGDMEACWELTSGEGHPGPPGPRGVGSQEAR